MYSSSFVNLSGLAVQKPVCQLPEVTFIRQPADQHVHMCVQYGGSVAHSTLYHQQPC